MKHRGMTTATLITLTILAQSAQAATIKTENVTKLAASGEEQHVTTSFAENGLMETMTGNVDDEVIKPQYRYDDKDNLEQILFIMEPTDPSLQMLLRMDNTYEGDTITAVTVHMFDANKKELTIEDKNEGEMLTLLQVMQSNLENYDAYENCEVTFAGTDAKFTKVDGKVMSETVIQSVDYTLDCEYNELHQPIRKVLHYWDGDDTEDVMTYDYDESGRLTHALYEGADGQQDKALEYTESKDDEGNTVYEDSDGVGFRYVYDQNGELLEFAQKVDGSEVDTYDNQGNITKKELYYGNTVPTITYEYEFYE